MGSRHLRLMAYTVRPYATSRRQHLLSWAWSGFIRADEKAKLQSVLNKAVRYGFLTDYKLVVYLFESSDTTLFSAILRRPDHVLHPLLSPLKTTGYHLRKRSHGLNYYLRFSLVFFEKELYISNVIHGHLLNLFLLWYCVFFEYVIYYFTIIFLYFNLHILM